MLKTVTNPVHDVISKRVSAGLFVPGLELSRDDIERLLELATRAPSSFNLQNWRFVVVDTQAAKEKLRALAYGQSKITEAAAVVIVVGTKPDADRLQIELARSVKAKLVPAGYDVEQANMAHGKYDNDAQVSRDEAIRSASLAAGTLMIAAAADGLATCPMHGFDSDGVSMEFKLSADEIPVMLVAIGQASPDAWPQKLRLPLSSLLTYA